VPPRHEVPRPASGAHDISPGIQAHAGRHRACRRAGISPIARPDRGACGPAGIGNDGSADRQGERRGVERAPPRERRPDRREAASRPREPGAPTLNESCSGNATRMPSSLNARALDASPSSAENVELDGHACPRVPGHHER
jgi:hypothetical protein